MIRNILLCLLVLLIPLMLFMTVKQASTFTVLENEVRNLEKKQYEIVQLNKRMISGISVLSSPERIEKVAVEQLGMRRAKADEIMRISLTKGDLGG